MRRHKKHYRSFIIFLITICIFGLYCIADKDNLFGKNNNALSGDSQSFSLENIPAYSGTPYVAVNGNIPEFSEQDYTSQPFENYSELDALGRCGVAYANVCKELMPTEERGEIGMIKPSGWQTVKYDFVDGKYLYNRCHLIGYQLAGENANEKNLMTGTRYLNVEGMLPFENMVGDYVEDTNNHVLYRATPIFEGENLLASGVQVEAYSVEDEGKGICFNVYIYNVQPGVEIDYRTGESAKKLQEVERSVINEENISEATGTDGANELTEYVLNKRSKVFHMPECDSVNEMSEKNKLQYTGSRDAVIEQGYRPCERCKP